MKAPPPSSPRGKSPLQVLLVDDDLDQRSASASLLQFEGCSVLTAQDGAAALRVLRKQKVDVIVMDLDMPRVSGWDAIDMVRRRSGNEQPYVIVLSALADAQSRSSAFQAGCNEYIVKPGDILGALRAFAWRRQRSIFSGLRDPFRST